jgi:hypothetical protein
MRKEGVVKVGGVEEQGGGGGEGNLFNSTSNEVF